VGLEHHAAADGHVGRRSAALTPCSSRSPLFLLDRLRSAQGEWMETARLWAVSRLI
jgi:hypothetical protein